MLFLVEVFDTITGFFVLAEPRLVFTFLELRLFIPQSALDNVDCNLSERTDSEPGQLGSTDRRR